VRKSSLCSGYQGFHWPHLKRPMRIDDLPHLIPRLRIYGAKFRRTIRLYVPVLNYGTSTDKFRNWTPLCKQLGPLCNTKFSARAANLAFSDGGAQIHYYFCNCLIHEGEGGRFLRNVANQRFCYVPLNVTDHVTCSLKYHLRRRFKSARMSRSGKYGRFEENIPRNVDKAFTSDTAKRPRKSAIFSTVSMLFVIVNNLLPLISNQFISTVL
jgi:hypothetical protein